MKLYVFRKYILLISLISILVSCGDSNVEVEGLKVAALSLSSDDSFTIPKTLKFKKRFSILRIKNTGDKEATEMNLSLSGTGISQINFAGGVYPGTVNPLDPNVLAGAAIPASGNCSSTLAVGAECTVVIEFFPPDNATYSISYNGSFNNLFEAVEFSGSLTGTGANEAKLDFTILSGLPNLSGGPATYFYNFERLAVDAGGLPNQRGMRNATFNLTNNGEWPAEAVSYIIPNLPAPNNDVYTITSNTCPVTLIEGDSCYIDVQFSPPQLSFFNYGLNDYHLDVDYDNGLAIVQADVQFQGQGVTPAVVSLTSTPDTVPNQYEFGTFITNTTGTKTFNLANSGSFDAEINLFATNSSVAVPFRFTGNSFPGNTLSAAYCNQTNSAGNFIIPAGSNCNIEMEALA